MHRLRIGFSALALLALPACGGDDGGSDVPDAGGTADAASQPDGPVAQECLPTQISADQTVTLASPLPLMGDAPERTSPGVVLQLNMENPTDGVAIQFTEGAGVFADGFDTVDDGSISTDPQNCGACMLGFVNAPVSGNQINIGEAELIYGPAGGTIQITNYQDPVGQQNGNIAGSVEGLTLAPAEGDCEMATVNFDFDFDLTTASSANRELPVRGPFEAAELAPR